MRGERVMGGVRGDCEGWLPLEFGEFDENFGADKPYSLRCSQ